MAAAFKFELVSPERLLMSEDVTEVDVPGSDGRFGVLAGHAPVMSTIEPGVIDITMADGKQVKFFVRGGFADVSASGLTILAEKALPLAELKPAVMEQEIKLAEGEIELATNDEARAAAELRLYNLKALGASLPA